MAGIVEDYLESPGMDNDTDDVFPCKGCGEVCCSTRPKEHCGISLLTGLEDPRRRKSVRVRYVTIFSISWSSGMCHCYPR